jgi:protein TonB
MTPESTIRDTHARDLRLGGALSLAVHAALLLLVGLAVTHSRARFTAPAVQTLRVDVDIPVTTPSAEPLVTPGTVALDGPQPQPLTPPRPDLPPPAEERIRFTDTPQDPAPAAPESVAPATAAGLTTMVATEPVTKRFFPAEATAPALSTVSASAATSAATAVSLIPGPPRGGAITLRRELHPPYPHGARQRGEEGTVVLETTVTPAGEATQVTVVTSSGFPDLDRAATKALQRASFHPATEEGRAVEGRARLTIIFRLTNP